MKKRDEKALALLVARKECAAIYSRYSISASPYLSIRLYSFDDLMTAFQLGASSTTKQKSVKRKSKPKRKAK